MMIKLVKTLVCCGAITALSWGCSSSSDDDSTAGTTAESSSDSTAESTTTADSLNLVGSLSLASGSSSSSASLNLLADSDTYWLKCVTLDVTSASACIDQTDENLAYDLTCEGFKGKAFGCFVLQGADESNLSIVAVVSSSQLAAGSDTSKFSLSIEFDPSTGSASVDEVKQTNDAEEEVSAEAVVAGEVAAMDIEDGLYGFCFNDVAQDKINDAHKGDVKIEDSFNACNGYTEEKYLYFQTASDTGSLPILELWKNEASRDACLDANGAIAYSISDGTRTISFNESTANFDTLFNTVYNNGTNAWLPTASVESYQISLNQGAEEKDDSKDGMEAVYGEGQICSGMVDDLIAAYDKATLKNQRGRSVCEGYSFVSGAASGVTNSADLDESFNSGGGEQGGGPPDEWCSDYKRAKDADERAEVKKRFLSECKAHIEGEGGDELFRKQQVVWGFLEALAESRHEGGGDSRFNDLRAAFNEANAAGVDLTEDNISSLSTTCDSGDGDTALANVAIAWAEVDWNWERARWTENAINDNGALVCSAISFDHFGQTKTFTNGRELLKTLFTNKFHQGDPKIGIAALNEQVCQNSWDLDFSRVDTSDSYFTDFYGKLDTSGHEPKWDNTKVSTEADKKTILTAFMRGLTAKSGEEGFVTGGPFVFGCTATRIKQDLQQLTQSNESLGGGGHQLNPDDIVRHMGWQLTEQIVQKAITDINTSYNSGSNPLTALDPAKSAAEAETLATTQMPALATKIANLAIDHPMRYGWMIQDLCFFVDLGTLTLNEALACGQALPSDSGLKNFICGGPGGPGGGEQKGAEGAPAEGGEQKGGDALALAGAGGASCSLPQYFSQQDATKKQILAELARRVTEVKGHDAFRNDEAFKKLKRKIIASSACLPDASISHTPILDENDNLTFGLEIRGPVNRTLAGDLNIDLNFDETAESTETKFIVEATRLQKNDGGMGSQACYWGEVQRLKNLIYDADEGTLTGTYTNGFIDTCRNAGSNDSGSSGGSGDEEQHSHHRTFQATFNPSSQL